VELFRHANIETISQFILTRRLSVSIAGETVPIEIAWDPDTSPAAAVWAALSGIERRDGLKIDVVSVVPGGKSDFQVRLAVFIAECLVSAQDKGSDILPQNLALLPGQARQIAHYLRNVLVVVARIESS
jgi:hypothetical protein